MSRIMKFAPICAIAAILLVPTAAHALSATMYLRNSSQGQTGIQTTVQVADRFNAGDEYQLAALTDPYDWNQYVNHEVGFAVEIYQAAQGQGFYPAIHVVYGPGEYSKNEIVWVYPVGASVNTYHRIQINQTHVGWNLYDVWMDNWHLDDDVWWPHAVKLTSRTGCEAFGFTVYNRQLGHNTSIRLRDSGGVWRLQDSSWANRLSQEGDPAVYGMSFNAPYYDWIASY